MPRTLSAGLPTAVGTIAKKTVLTPAIIVTAALVLMLAAMATQTAHAQAAESTSRSFNIPASSLEDALNAFAQQAGITLSFNPELVQDKRAAGLSGRYTMQEGLDRLLAGHELQVESAGNDAYLIRARSGAAIEETDRRGSATSNDGDAVLPEIMVTGKAQEGNGLPPVYAGGQVASGGQLGLLGNRDIMDAPFNITSYTSTLIEDQQAHSVADLLVANDPSVRIIGGRGDLTDTYLVRGFAVNNSDLAFNGLYGLLPYWRVPVESAERVEVLKGPSALLGGMSPGGSVGGNINLVPKRAADEPLTRLSLDYMSDAQFGTHLDVGRRYGEDNRFGVRFNGVYQDGDTALDGQSREFPLASLGLDFQGERLRLFTDILYQKETLDGVQRPVIIGQATSVPAPPDGDRLIGLHDSYLEQEDFSVIAGGELDLTEAMTAFAKLGGRYSSYDTVAANVMLTAGGNGEIDYSSARQRHDRRTFSGEVGVRGELQTGPVHHDWTLSVNGYRERAGFVFNFFAPVPGNTLYAPASVAAPAGMGALDGEIPKTNETFLSSLALADTMSTLDDRVQLTLGVRRQQIDSDNFDPASGQLTASYDERVWTPMFGVVVKPWQNLSLYANYIQGLSQGEEAPVTAVNAGEMLAPYKTEQYELGMKYDWGRIATTLSAFEISRPNALVGPDNVFRSDGEQRNRGLELNVFGEPFNGLRVLAGATYIQPKQNKTAGGVNQGNDAQGVPREQLNLGLDWDVPNVPGLSVNGRWIYTGSVYIDTANNIKAPAWDRLDVGAAYKLNVSGKPVTLRANIENLLDENYWMAYSYLSVGAPRTLMLSLTTEF